MSKNDNREKVARVLSIYNRLMNGGIVNKSAEAARFNVTERSIQRDVDDIRNFLDETEDNGGIINNVIYDRIQKGYMLERIYDLKLTNPEILAICKILLDSRSLTKEEMDSLLKKLIDCCVPEDSRKLVNNLISNERFHYIQPKHGRKFIQTMWEIGMAVQESRFIEFDYQGIQGHTPKHRKVKPVAIMFSEFYFYMVGFIDNINKEEAFSNPEDLFPTIYRIDRIKNFKNTGEHFKIPYKDRFEEGEFRKRIQFMFGGKLRKVRFVYKGYSIEAIEDRLPTAKVIKQEDGTYIVEADVFGDGIDMWLRSQGDIVRTI